MSKYDFIILGVLLFFALFGFLRGFVTELFEALGIITAALFARKIALAIAPHLPNSVPEYMRAPLSTFVLSILLIFTVKAIGSALRKAFVKKRLKGIDHFLGGFMGVGKGLIVVVLLLALLSLTPLAQTFAKAPKPSPVFNWTLNKSKPVLARFTATANQMVRQQLKTVMGGSIVTDADTSAGTFPTLTPSERQMLHGMSAEDRAAVAKLLQDPTIKKLNLSQDDLLKLVAKLRESTGGSTGR